MKSEKKPRIPRKIKKEAKRLALKQFLFDKRINIKKLRVYVAFGGKHTYYLYEVWIEKYPYLSR